MKAPRRSVGLVRLFPATFGTLRLRSSSVTPGAIGKRTELADKPSSYVSMSRKKCRACHGRAPRANVEYRTVCVKIQSPRENLARPSSVPAPVRFASCAPRRSGPTTKPSCYDVPQSGRFLSDGTGHPPRPACRLALGRELQVV